MNDNNLGFNIKDDTYRATSNLNTAIENPEVSINNAMGVNLEDVDDSGQSFNSFNQNFLNSTNIYSAESVANENIGQINNTNINSANSTLVNNNSKVNYKPTMKQKKKPNEGLAISKEVKMMAFISFVLLFVIFVIPYIYDILKELDLVITTR